jgi:hypothetical protein
MLIVALPYKKHLMYEAMRLWGHWAIGQWDYGAMLAFELFGYRAMGPWDIWPIGLLGYETMRLKGYRAVGL